MLTYTGPKAIMTAGGTHDSTQTYEALTVVFDSVSGNSYVSKIDVPTGISLDNTTYWQISANPNEAVTELLEDVADLQGDVSDLQTAVAGKIDADVVVDTAQDLEDLTETGHLADALLVKDVYLRGADDIDYDNTSSGLVADDIQGAIDEVNGKTNTLDSTKAAKTQISNPNLIDNPWFTVNQRGLSSYSSSNTYTVDRWKNIQTTTATVAVTDDGITITHDSSSNEVAFVQRMEGDYFAKLVGKTITLSVMLSDGTIKSGSVTVPSSIVTTPTTIFTFDIDGIWDAYIYGRVTSQGSNIGFRSTTANSVLSLKAVKLEVGSISTLALDTAPNFQQELAKCQRYFTRFKTSGNNVSTIAGMAVANSIARFGIALPVEMRALPALTYSNLSHWGASPTNASGALVATACAVQGRMGNVICFEITNSSITASTIYILYALNAGAYLDFSADL